MKNKPLLLLYLVILALELLSRWLDWETSHLIVKPLLIPALLAYTFISSPKGKNKKLLIAALVACWAGDCLLLFDDNLHFLLGLLAFLAGHIFYIVIFLSLRKKESYRSYHFWTILLAAAYYLILMRLLYPLLGSLLPPVLLYGYILCFMLLSAVHSMNNKAPGFLLITSGALLFVCSDSLLAFDKFHSPVAYAPLLVMSTYGIAQLLLVTGILKHDSARMK